VTLWQGVLLGLVQGLTEFLPVSSSGHLVLAETLAGVETPGVFVEVALHVATLASVLVVYGGRLWSLLQGVLRGRRDDLRYAGLLAAATVPAGLVGVLLNDVVERAFDSLAAAGAGFLVTGIVLWSTRRAPLPPDPGRPRWVDALAIGLAQAGAILPGISRSGSTVSAGLWCRLAPAPAAEFSFLMAVPGIAGAALLESREAVADIGAVGAIPLAAGCVVALVSGVWAIRFLVTVLQRGRLYGFAPYCWAVGALTLGIALWRG